MTMVKHQLFTALDKMVVPATPFFFKVHFPVVNPKIKIYTLILGLEKIAKFAPDRVCWGLGITLLSLLLEPGGLWQIIVNVESLPWAPGASNESINDLTYYPGDQPENNSYMHKEIWRIKMSTLALQLLLRFLAILAYTMPRVCSCTLPYRNLITVTYRTVRYGTLQV